MSLSSILSIQKVVPYISATPDNQFVRKCQPKYGHFIRIYQMPDRFSETTREILDYKALQNFLPVIHSDDMPQQCHNKNLLNVLCCVSILSMNQILKLTRQNQQ